MQYARTQTTHQSDTTPRGSGNKVVCRSLTAGSALPVVLASPWSSQIVRGIINLLSRTAGVFLLVSPLIMLFCSLENPRLENPWVSLASGHCPPLTIQLYCGSSKESARLALDDFNRSGLGPADLRTIQEHDWVHSRPFTTLRELDTALHTIWKRYPDAVAVDRFPAVNLMSISLEPTVTFQSNSGADPIEYGLWVDTVRQTLEEAVSRESPSFASAVPFHWDRQTYLHPDTGRLMIVACPLYLIGLRAHLLDIATFQGVPASARPAIASKS